MLKIAGELGTKSARTRRRFLRVLSANARNALTRAGVPGQVEARWSRLFVRTSELPTAMEVLSRVFGLHSVSEVAVVSFGSLDELVERVANVNRDRVADRTFAVRVKRSGTHPFRSPDVAVALGTALLPGSAGVNLDDPAVEVRLEIADDEVYSVLDAMPGAGGLPVGTGGKAVAMFSGGFDSPVASWMAMRRGIELELLVLDLGGCGQVDAALTVARDLVTRWAPGREPKAKVVDLSSVVAALRARVAPSIRQVLLKRAMYRAGSLAAADSGAEALITGESLGQVSTQTLHNLAVAEESVGLPVLRPLIGMDKEEILRRARTIGTHDASERVQEHCDIATGRVETAARLRDVVGAEGALDESFVATAVNSAQSVDLTSWTPGPPPAHVIDDVPAGAVIVDVREPQEGATIGHVRLPFSRAAEWAPGLDRTRTYVFVCTHGNRSEAVAHDLRQRGLEAFSLSGGTAGPGIRAA